MFSFKAAVKPSASENEAPSFGKKPVFNNAPHPRKYVDPSNNSEKQPDHNL